MLDIGIGPWAGPVFGGSGAVAVDPASYALYLDFKHQKYWAGGVEASPITALPGYAFTRSGTQAALDSDGSVDSFAANVAAINGLGYHAHIAETNNLLNAGSAANLTTQNVTVTATAYTLAFIGTGTITLSGAATAGPLVGTGANQQVALNFTPAAGTLTLTVAGDVRYAVLVGGALVVPVPIIATAGATATIGPAALTHTMSALTDQDMLIWLTGMGDAAATRHKLSDGTNNNRIQWLNSGVFRVYAATVLVYNTGPAAEPSASNFTGVLRRLGGAWQAGKIVSGVLTWAGSIAAAMPAGLTTVQVAHTDNATQLKGVAQGMFIKPGSFASDAAVLAAVAEAG